MLWTFWNLRVNAQRVDLKRTRRLKTLCTCRSEPAQFCSLTSISGHRRVNSSLQSSVDMQQSVLHVLAQRIFRASYCPLSVAALFFDRYAR